MSNDRDNRSLEYNGHCAFAVSTEKLDVKGGSHRKNYAFLNPVAKLLFKLLPGRIKKANAVWGNR